MVAAVPQDPPEELPQGDRFFVQVASFRSLERAGDMYAELVERGHDASVFTVFDSDDKPWYVLRVGEFATREEAERAGEEYRVREGSPFTIRAFDVRLLRERTIAPESLPLEAEQ
jgi:cell division protein FtsN